MMSKRVIAVLIGLFCATTVLQAQQKKDSLLVPDSLNKAVEDSLIQQKKAIADAIKQKMQADIDSLKKVADSLSKASIASASQEERKRLITQSDSLKAVADTLTQRADLNYLKANARPVVLDQDTLFYIYANLGPYSAEDRASNIEARLKQLTKQFNYYPDSLKTSQSEGTWNITYKSKIILTILPEEAKLQKLNQRQVAQNYLKVLKPSLQAFRDKSVFRKWLAEVGWVLLILLVVYILYRLVNIAFKQILKKVYSNRQKWFTGIKIKNYELFEPHRELQLIFLIIRTVRLMTLLVILYLTLPLIFSIFPSTKGIADTLLNYVLSPLRRMFVGVVNYISNLFDITIIVVCTHYILRVLKFFSNEVANKKLVIQGFYADWAKPTYNIIRILALAFMFVLIFPYLPGSDSPIFKGVSVFVGVLFSLGSSSAISNIIAGLVITYMRPFQISDRVKIGEVVGDVIEKNLLITRIKTIKNEEITIPNSSILSGHTINFTSSKQYLIHSKVTIGYDVPWRKVHNMLIDAADDTQFILQDPKPFILQTSLDDFYVSYEVNAYISDTTKIPEAYSEMHQHIQDKFNEAGVEILSPHYRAVRDGGQQTNPLEYLPKDYQSPPIKVKRVD